MQPINPHTLFSIFEQGDEEVYKEHGVEDALKNPYVLMGMVLRGVENYQLMDLMYMRQYQEQYKEVRGKVKYKYFVRLYSYLERIDSIKFETFYRIGEAFAKQEVYMALETLKMYFERLEEYEKCAVIKRFQELLEEATVNLPLVPNLI
jgi:replicative superfamily II helicase